jgi:hypothetical protein
MTEESIPKYKLLRCSYKNYRITIFDTFKSTGASKRVVSPPSWVGSRRWRDWAITHVANNIGYVWFHAEMGNDFYIGVGLDVHL